MIARTLAIIALLGAAAFAAAQTAPEMLLTKGDLKTPELRRAGVDLAVGKMPPGPFKPDWASLRQHYRDPAWFGDAKFGIMMHWGVFSVPAHGSEWYVRYMYGTPGFMRWHAENFGPQSKFGYKDFIPGLTAAKWQPDQWAALFRASGARYVVAAGEHHDGFSMWNSRANRFNAVQMGPKRDIVGDLGTAVRAAGLKYGIADHSNVHFNFIPAMPGSDQYDPEWKDFYSVADRSDAARKRFLEQWVAKNIELIDQYKPDLIYYDTNGGDRTWDAQRTAVAAYYYNRANAWGKQVAVTAKGESYLAGAIMDYERQGRIRPRGIKSFPWQVDDPIGNKFAYVTEIKYKPADLLIRRLVDVVSMNGNYLLNISPRADGTIPDEQQALLREVGAWLKVNGEAIYGTRPWVRYGEGPFHDAAPDLSPEPGPDDPPAESYTAREVRFTTKGPVLYATLMDWPGAEAVIKSLGTDTDRRAVRRVELLGHAGSLRFKQQADGLHVTMPATRVGAHAYVLKITR